MSGCLYVVGTPIGNLSDLSPRALKTLGEADFIAAEDTRVTRKLLSHFDLHKPMVSYFEHNRAQREEMILKRLKAGENCALVTDAGMPAVSDPGTELVDLCHQNGIKVESVPGPSAAVTALSISGMLSGRFSFEGFLSTSKKERSAHLEEIKNLANTLVFYEAPHKLSMTLSDLYETLGDRRIAIVREITKLHEQVIRTTLEKAAAKFSDNDLKGEIVLIVEGAKPAETVFTLDEAAKLAQAFLKEGRSLSEAARLAAAETGIKKGNIYKKLLNHSD